MTKQEKAARNKAYRLKHKAHYAALYKAWRLSHKAEKAASRKAYNEAHAEERAAYSREWKRQHKAEWAEYMKLWAEKHRDHRAKYGKAYRLENADKVKASQKTYALANPDKMADKWARRRALKLSVTVENVSRAEVYKRDRGRCHLCGKKVPKRRWHMDHIIPLARGGEHSYANVSVSCPTCNMRKGVKAGAQLRLSL